MPDLIPDPPQDVCAACGAALADAFCPACGQARVRGRLHAGEILRELRQRVFDLDSNLLRTTWACAVRPNAVVLDWLRGRRRPHTPPLRFFVAMMVLAIAATALLRRVAPLDPRAEIAMRQLQASAGRMGVAGADWAETLGRTQWAFVAIFLPCFALGLWTFFRPWKRTFAEHLACASFVYGGWVPIGLALLVVDTAIGSPTGSGVAVISSVGGIAWGLWAVPQCFPGASAAERLGRAFGAGCVALGGACLFGCLLGVVIVAQAVVAGFVSR